MQCAGATYGRLWVALAVCAGLLLAFGSADAARAQPKLTEEECKTHKGGQSFTFDPSWLQRDPTRERACEPGHPYFAAWSRLQSATPEVDADQAIARGDFTFRCPPDQEYPHSVWHACSIQCVFGLYQVERSENWLARPAKGEWSKCAFDYRTAAEKYAKVYNARILASPAFPNRDVCRDPKEPGDRSDTWRYPILLNRLPRPQDTPSDVTDIATAARFGLTGDVRRLLAAGNDPNALDALGVHGLQWAAARNHEEIVDLLLQARAVATTRWDSKTEIERWSPARLAALYGHIAILRKLVAAEPDPGTLEPDQLLELAAILGHMDTIRFLAEELKAPLTRKRPDDRPAAGAAIRNEQDHVVAYLLDRGLDADSRYPNPLRGGCADALLDHAIGWRRTKVVQMLLERGAKWDARMFTRAVHSGNQEWIKAFLAHGADLNAPNEDGQLPLVTAATASSSIQTMKFLLAAGASPNGRSKDGLTPLMAILKGQFNEGPSVSQEGRVSGRHGTIIKSRIDPKRPNDLPSALAAASVLLSAGADLEATDAEGKAVLHYAATSDYNLPIVALLAAYGAKINAQDRQGRTPLDYAIERGLERVPPDLTSRGGRTGEELKRR